MSALQNLPSNINYLSPVGFRFTLANFPDVNYFCQAANIPGLSIGGIDVGTPLRNIQIAGDEVAFEELTIQFVVDENMKNWISIYDWIISIGTPTQESIRKYVKLDAQDEKTQDATLTVLTSNMNPQMHFYKVIYIYHHYLIIPYVNQIQPNCHYQGLKFLRHFLSLIVYEQ